MGPHLTFGTAYSFEVSTHFYSYVLLCSNQNEQKYTRAGRIFIKLDFFAINFGLGGSRCKQTGNQNLVYRSNKTKHFFFHRHLSSVAYCRSKGWLGWAVSYLWSRLCHILLIYSVPNFYILSYTFICWYILFLFTNFYSWKFEFQQFAWLVCSHSSIESWLCSAEHFQIYYVEEEFWRHPSRVKTF